MSEMIQATLEAERLELLDLSLRNPLLNYKTLRARGIDIVDEDPAQLYDVLVERTRAMTFSEAPEESEVGTGPDPKRHTDSKIQTTHPADELEKRLRNTQYSARTFVEEQGVNVLFLALGTLVWYEDDNSQLVRRAPLLLIPVELHREEVRAPFKLTCAGTVAPAQPCP